MRGLKFPQTVNPEEPVGGGGGDVEKSWHSQPGDGGGDVSHHHPCGDELSVDGEVVMKTMVTAVAVMTARCCGAASPGNVMTEVGDGS